MALAADPDTALDADAVCVWDFLDAHGPPMLPEWYMPPSIGIPRVRPGWRRVLAVVTILAFIAIDAYGLCSTYGQLVVG